MGLQFIFGRAGTGKTERCCREIKEYMMGGRERSAILLVPDQETFRVERRLAASMPGKGFTNVTVCGFSRLAYEIFQELHSPIEKISSPMGQQLILRHILLENQGQLQVLQKSAARPHFSSALARFFQDLDSYLLSEADLEKAAAKEGSTPLGKKLSDLALLLKRYHESPFYGRNLFDLLAREIPKSKLLAGSRIWIDGFDGMTPQKVHLVSILVKTALDVTVTIPMDSPDEAEKNPNFAKPYLFYKLLSEKIKADSVDTLKEDIRFTSPRLRALARDFFARWPSECSLPKNKDGINEGIHVIKAAGRMEEAEAVCRIMVSLARDKKYRYRDMLVLVRKPDDYIDFFERAFRKYEIPGFIDVKKPMNNTPLVMLLDGLVRFLTAETEEKESGWQAGFIFRMLKASLLRDFSVKTVCRLENFVLAHHIRPKDWHKEWDFHDYRDLSNGSETKSKAEELNLNRANRYRNMLIDLLDPLAEKWAGEKSSPGRCQILYEWLKEQRIPNRLYSWDEKEWKKTGVKPHLPVWKKVLRLLEEIVHSTEGKEMDAKDFLTVFENGLSSLTYSTIPPTLDHVTVTGMDRGYGMEGRAVFIPGALEGDFPLGVEESGFFTDIEKQKIKTDCHLTLGADLMQTIHEEQFYTYLALTRASDVLYITYPAIRDGQKAEPSALLGKLEGLHYVSEKRSPQMDHSFFCHPDQALSLLPPAIEDGTIEENQDLAALCSWASETDRKKKMLARKLACLSYTNEAVDLPLDLVDGLFRPQGKFSASITRFQQYRRCPYSYFLQYGLNLKERDDGSLQKSDFGTLLHAGLYEAGKRVLDGKRQWKDLTDADMQSLSEQMANEFSPRLKYGGLQADYTSRYVEKNLLTTFKKDLEQLRHWSRNSQFEAQSVEEEVTLDIPDGNDKLTVAGRIDRVDTLGRDAIVVDYKTGSDKPDLQQMLEGLQLQLLTYALALSQKGKELRTIACIYVHLSHEINSVSFVVPEGEKLRDKEDPLAGLFMHDVDALKKLDIHLDPAGHSEEKFLPLEITQKNVLHARRGLHLCEGPFQVLLDRTKDKLLSLYHEISAGHFPISPYMLDKGTGCDFCPFKAICRFDPNREEEDYDCIEKRSSDDIKKELTEDVLRDHPDLPAVPVPVEPAKKSSKTSSKTKAKASPRKRPKTKKSVNTKKVTK